MTAKQMLLSAFIFITTSSITLAEDTTTTTPPELPSLQFVHIATIRALGYDEESELIFNYELMDQNTLEKFKEKKKEKNFAICPCSINSRTTNVRIYNPHSPFLEEKLNPCEILKKILAQTSPEKIKALEEYLFPKK